MNKGKQEKTDKKVRFIVGECYTFTQEKCKEAEGSFFSARIIVEKEWVSVYNIVRVCALFL